MKIIKKSKLTPDIKDKFKRIFGWWHSIPPDIKIQSKKNKINHIDSHKIYEKSNIQSN